MYVHIHMAFMVNRGKIRQHSCNDIYTGNPVVLGGKPVIFPLYQKNFPHGQTWHGSQDYLREETQATKRS